MALAAQIGARAPLATITALVVLQLHQNTGLDALVAIPSYRATVCVVHSNGDRAVQPPLGDVRPAHCTATGKVLLAYRHPWRRSILAARLIRCTNRSITDPRELERELAHVRLHGHATEDGEHIEGARQLAAPITITSGETVAAIALAIHDSRPLAELADEVKQAAHTASNAIATAAESHPLHRGVMYRLLTSYGLAAVDAHL